MPAERNMVAADVRKRTPAGVRKRKPAKASQQHRAATWAATGPAGPARRPQSEEEDDLPTLRAQRAEHIRLLRGLLDSAGRAVGGADSSGNPPTDIRMNAPTDGNPPEIYR